MRDSNEKEEEKTNYLVVWHGPWQLNLPSSPSLILLKTKAHYSNDFIRFHRFCLSVISTSLFLQSNNLTTSRFVSPCRPSQLLPLPSLLLSASPSPPLIRSYNSLFSFYIYHYNISTYCCDLILTYYIPYVIQVALKASNLKMVSMGWAKNGFPSLKTSRFRVSCAVCIHTCTYNHLSSFTLVFQFVYLV